MKNSTAKEIKNVLLIGAGFRNKGAEAMVINATRCFSRMYPGCRVMVASYSKKESRPYGEHTVNALSPDEEPIRFELIKNTKKLSHPLRILLWWLLPFKSVRHLLVQGDLYLERFSYADLVVDFSGFALSDQRSLKRCLTYYFEIFTSRCFNVPFVSFTQAMGPFKKLSTRVGAKIFLPQVDLLIARDQSTHKYLKGIGLDRKMPIPVCADSAFLFEPTPAEMEEGKKLIKDARAKKGLPLFGIVPNIVILQKEKTQNEHSSYIKMLVRLCNHVQRVLGAHVVFICHEWYEYRQDDEWLTQQVIQQVDYPEQITVVSAKHPAGVLKAVIGQQDFVVVSRFHSLVAAISTMTPFFALGWSHKYAELASDAGIDDGVLDFFSCSEERVIEAIENAWNRRKETRKRLEAEHNRLRNSAEKAFQLVAEKWPGRRA